MNQDAIRAIGKKQASRKNTLLFMVNEVDGLVDTFDKDFSEWSDFDSWENMSLQQWLFSRAMDIYLGKKFDIKCKCCEVINLNQVEIKNIYNQKCCGIKSVYMIEKIVSEIISAKERRESDGTYSV